MTRLGVLADIHGNLPALQAVIEDMAAFKVDHVVVGGDCIVGAPFPAQVMETVITHNWAVIRGNNAFYLLDYDTSRAPESWRSYSIPPVLHEQLGGHWTRVIASLPDTLSLRFRDAPPVRVVHGIPGDPWTPIYPQTSLADIRRYLAGVQETTVICAHSHIALDRQVDHWHLINPGSVGVPLDGQFKASYMVLEGSSQGWNVIAHRRVPFDYEPIFAEFERQRFEERCGADGRLVIEEFRTAQLRLYPFARWVQIHHPDEPRTQAMVDTFLQSDIETYVPEPYRRS